MNKTRKKSNHLVLSLLVAAGLLLPSVASAQGGVFGRGDSDIGARRKSGMLRDSETTLTLSNQHFGHSIWGDDVTNQNFGGIFVQPDDITNQTFGTPVGSGLFILLAAGAGYATLKNKTNKTLKNSK